MFDFFRKYTKIMHGALVLADLPVVRAVRRRAATTGAAARARRSRTSTARDITQARVGRAAPQRGRPHPPADAQHRRQAARFATRRATPRWSAWCATACSRRPRRRRNMTVSDERLARALRRKTRAWPPSARADGKFDRERFTACDGPHARAVRSVGARRSGHAAGAAGRVGHGLRHARAGRRHAQRLLRAPRGAGGALQPGRLRGQGRAERRRPRGLLQGAHARSSRRPSRPASSTWCSTSTRSRRTSPSTRPTSRPTTTRTPRASAPRKSAAPATS